MLMPLLTLFFGLLLSVLHVTAADSPKIRNIAKGGFSGIQQETEVVVTNSTQWADLWKKHSARKVPAAPAPEIDFDKESVLFVALGQKRSGGYAVEIADLKKVAEKTEVLVKTRAPRPGGMQIQALTAPFHIVAVPKISGPVKFKLEAGEAPATGKR